MIAEILLAVILLVVIVILGIHRPVRYIGRLKEECEILGSGISIIRSRCRERMSCLFWHADWTTCV